MTSERPNILWITTHDINPDLGAYRGVWPGAEYADTPHLDRLAAQGVRFDRAYAVAPVCAPSRSAMITGMFPTAIGTHQMRSKAVPPPEVRCFTEYLRAAGYHCSHNGTTDHQFFTPFTAFDRFGPQAHWRDRRDPRQPFFAAFHGAITHESQLALDDDAFARATARLTPQQRHDPAAAPLPPYYPDTPVFRQAWARYADLISAMDHWVGDLLAQLEEDGLADRTMVVFCSDHGAGLPRAKRLPYESGLREPLIVRWPGTIAAGSVRSDPVYLMDLAATLLTAAGIAPPPAMHARPLFDAAGAPPAVPRTVVFGHRDRMDEQLDRSRTACDGRFRYLQHAYPDRPYLQHHHYADALPTWRELRRLSFEEANQLAVGQPPDRLTPLQRRLLQAKPAEELYDLAADPHETVNLAQDPAYAATLQRLRAALAEWQRDVGDLGLTDEAMLVARWRPDGIVPVTAAPQPERVGGRVLASCVTPGASIGWTDDPPDAAPPPSPFAAIVGDPPADARHWRLVTGPVVPPAGAARLWFRAQRLGYLPSDDVAIALDGTSP
jgi:N-sulfoglucosamine sulfohydrolase